MVRSDDKAYFIKADLNVLTDANSYDSLVQCLSEGISQAQAKCNFAGIHLLILLTGVYDYGPLGDAELNVRKNLLGVNVCGKAEVLHAALKHNKLCGFSSSEGLTIVDIGSLYGLFPGRKRALYGGSKALGLHVCASLQLGAEVKRALHIAPGPIDTHMLHRNYWVLKEGGSERFIYAVMDAGVYSYDEVFKACNAQEFEKQVQLQGLDVQSLRKTFERYKARRKQQRMTAEGLLDATIAARAIRTIIATGKEGIHIITSTGDQAKTRFVSFSGNYEHLQ